MALPLLAITMGDVNGIGPEILAKALNRPEPWAECRLLVIGSAAILAQAAKWAPQLPPIHQVDQPEDIVDGQHAVCVMKAAQTPPPYRPGQLSAEAGRCAVEWLKRAVHLAMARRVDGIVTCPLNKEGVHLAGDPFIGHTDLIADMTNSPDYRMCLFSDDMRIVHISSHCSLAEALRQVEPGRIEKSIDIADDALRRLRLPRRRIAVAALNPHAGEAGAFGDEETTKIAPAIKTCQRKGIDCSGPYPADTIFRRMREGEFDLVVSMYHDQGHIALKLIAMDEGVNVTLGIPIVRTSVDHGTAYDIAGTGQAREHSLICAIQFAARLARHDLEQKRPVIT